MSRLLRAQGLQVEDISGLGYNPLLRKAWQSRFSGINYLLSACKPA